MNLVTTDFKYSIKKCFGFLIAAALIFPQTWPTLAETPNHRLPKLSPRAVLGFEPGTSRTIADWTQITSYFRKLDKASERVELRVLGKTASGRDLFVVLISDADNLKRADRLMDVQRKLADPRRIKNAKERERLLRDGKAVVAITCSLHSVEIVASQMSMRLAYELATGKTPEIREILRDTVLLLFPSPNPDGIDIVADWYRGTLGKSFEGVNPPELYHRYAGHDNNRDWYMLTQPETQHVTRLFYRDWFPHVVYDIHQQGRYGSRMTLPPFHDPPNPNISALTLRQVATVGERIAADLTAKGFTGILTRAQFDTWWHGGLRSAPYYHNSVGLLSEAASAKLMTPTEIRPSELVETTRGLADPRERSTTFPEPWPGGTWRPEDIADMELEACRSVLKQAARYRREFLENFVRLGEREIALGKSQAPYGWIVPARQFDREAGDRLVNILWSQGIEIERTTRDFTVEGRKYDAGSYLISAAQPYRACVKALLEIQTYPDRSAASGEAERPYDITGWTLPLLMGVETTQIGVPVPTVETEPMTALSPPTAKWVDQPTPLQSAESETARIGVYHSAIPNEDEGWTRWLLDMRRVPYRRVTDADIRSSEALAGLDVLLVPDHSAAVIVRGVSERDYPKGFADGIGDEGVERLKAFVERGGKLVCLGRASDFAVEYLNLPVRNVLRGILTSEYFCPGSVVGLELESGTSDRPGGLCAFLNGGGAFEPVGKSAPVKVLARYARENPLRSGWLRGEKYLAGQPALVEVEIGKGRVVLFGFRPQFRGQSHATFELFLHAVSM